MNTKFSKKNIGKKVRLRPVANKKIPECELLPLSDDEWLVTSADDKVVELRNTRTDHILVLGVDNIHSFRTPNFLILRCQITLQGDNVNIEPLRYEKTL